MRKLKSILLTLMLAVALVSIVIPQDAFAADKDYVVDGADLLSSSEEADLEAKLIEISNRQNFDVVVVTTNSLDGYSSMEYADNFFDYNGYGYGANKDGCLLVVSMENRDFWISTTGFGITALTDAGIEYINNDYVSYLSDGDYYEAFCTYADDVDKFVTQAKNGEPYDVNNMPGGYSLGMCVFFAFLTGLVIALITVLIMRAQLKSVAPKATANDYFDKNSLHITRQHDFLAGHHVTKVKIESESSGGSSTHIGSSGTSHGGGGGHF